MAITAITQNLGLYGQVAEAAAQTIPSLTRKENQQQQEPVDVEKTLKELERVSLAFDRRLQFSFNSKIDQVVVKVIDKDTDKVIKEIPPKELQVVYERIREAVGVLLDERI
jgi:uncharacterized FlaG/YvyC family protein